MSMVFGWSLPRKIRESRRNRESLERRVDVVVETVNRASAVAEHSASRLERAAAALMEQHQQALVDSARELRRK